MRTPEITSIFIKNVNIFDSQLKFRHWLGRSNECRLFTSQTTMNCQLIFNRVKENHLITKSYTVMLNWRNEEERKTNKLNWKLNCKVIFIIGKFRSVWRFLCSRFTSGAQSWKCVQMIKTFQWSQVESISQSLIICVFLESKSSGARWFQMSGMVSTTAALSARIHNANCLTETEWIIAIEWWKMRGKTHTHTQTMRKR